MASQNRFVQFRHTGDLNNLEIQTEPIPTPGEDEILVQNKAIGFNFIDTYFLRGIYRVPLPFRSGSEGAGVVHAVGPNVKGFKVGDRVAYLARAAYADYAIAPANRAFKLPESISFDVAAASVLKGLTVQYLIEKIYTPERDEIVLFHAGAGGVGLIFLQWAASLGAKVITTVSTDEKAEIVRNHGAWQVLKYTDDIAARVKELTGGKKVKVVYDSVGKDTFESSLDSLAPRGLFISFGNASGPVEKVSLTIFSQKGSLFVTRPALPDYLEDIQAQGDSFLNKVVDGTIKINVNQTYKFVDVRQVFCDALARKTTGSAVIHP